MTTLRFIKATALCLLLAAPAGARQEGQQRQLGGQQKRQPPQQQPQPQQPQRQRQRQQQPQRQFQPQPQQRQRQEMSPRPGHQRQPERHGGGEQRAVWQQHRARNWQSEHRDWRQRGGYNGYRIPERHYRAHFGPEHAFRIRSFPLVVVGGYPRFQFGGFWFAVVDPWPEYWSEDWYDNDDVYIDYAGDGYYLYNRRYPGDRIAITVYVN